MVDADWREFTRVHEECCSVLDTREYMLEAVPTLVPAETVQVSSVSVDMIHTCLWSDTRL